MFQLYKNVFAFALLICVAISCSPKISPYADLLDNVQAKPEALQLHRDSVRFQLTGATPLKYLKEDVKVVLYPEYVYGEGALRLGETVPFDGAYVKSFNSVRVEDKYIFPYLPGMDSGTLLLKATVERKGKLYSVDQKQIGVGLNTLPMLTRMGQITPDEPIPSIGLYATSGEKDQDIAQVREFTVFFKSGSDVQESQQLSQALLDFFSTTPAAAIKQVTVTGLVSPEPAEVGQNTIAQKRADKVKTQLQSQFRLNADNILVQTRRNDWFDFRILLGDFEGINEQQKESYYRIIMNGNEYLSQLREIQKLNTYSAVSRMLFPKLRAAKVAVSLDNAAINQPELAASVYRMINEGKPLEGTSPLHLEFAGVAAKRLQEKEAIFQYMVQQYGTENALNNLGVVYLNQAHRELDNRERNMLISKAISTIQQANRVRPTAVAFHNLGQAYILRGDYFEAYVAISEASALEKEENNEFIRFNEGLRGALDIVNGDYKLATIRLNRAPATPHNLFNKGLAYFMAEDYANALAAFEESIQVNREFGYGFYGLALVAAVTKDKDTLLENLGKAINRSEYLRERAVSELLFKEFHQEKDFRDVLRTQ
jgi:tetratricopeptide (TPR) repeat protein